MAWSSTCPAMVFMPFRRVSHGLEGPRTGRDICRDGGGERGGQWEGARRRMGWEGGKEGRRRRGERTSA